MPYENERQICSDALTVQDACNLTGVLRSFHEAACWLQRNTKSTDAVCQHPAMKLFADKVASLTGMQHCSLDTYRQAHAACEKILED
jgi:hypothetical protein